MQMSALHHGMPLFQPSFSPLGAVTQSKGKGKAIDADLEEAFREAEKHTTESTEDVAKLNEAMDRLLLEQQQKGLESRPLSDFQK